MYLQKEGTAKGGGRMITEKGEVLRWMHEQPQLTNLGPDGIAHVHKCLCHILDWYYHDAPVGDFLTAMLHNDFINTVCRADDINGKVLDVYARFIYHHLPYNYREKARNPRAGVF
jgi:hypothetical protein